MNCLEAQSKIVAFIEDKLDNGEKLEFIRHIRSCNNCAEELEIYYTLLVGMKQLDDDIVPTTSYKDQMEEKLNSESKRRSRNIIMMIILGKSCFTRMIIRCLICRNIWNSPKIKIRPVIMNGCGNIYRSRIHR